MNQLKNNQHEDAITDYMSFYFKNKVPDCILYSEDGTSFKTHKEIFSQTKFMREVLKNEKCCGQIEIIFPCSKEELCYLVKFMNEGKIEFSKMKDCLKIIENLNKAGMNLTVSELFND